jgi:hypothetical protein
MEVDCVLCEICSEFLIFHSVVVTLCASRFNTKKYYIFFAKCICVFYTAVRRNSDYFPVLHLLTNFITDVECVS